MTTSPEGGLLGDSGYMYPLTAPFAILGDDRERKFNDAHGRTRVVVERALGV